MLVVEDDADVRALTCRRLRALGYRVEEAVDGEEALGICERSLAPIDLVLTDVVMPRMSGIELARRLARVGGGIRLVFMSGYAGDEQVPPELTQPGAAFLQKPFSSDALGRKVREVLEAGR